MLSREEIRYLSHLAQIRLSADEEITIAQQMENVLQHFQLLDKLQISGSDDQEPRAASSWLREDSVKPSLPLPKALQNAPLVQDTYFAVPPMLTK